MTAKRWCCLTTAIFLLFLLSIIGLVTMVDPFEIYHRAWFYNPPYDSKTQMYANAGVARFYTYDSVIIGSSMTENFTPSQLDQLLGGRFVKLCMNGGQSLDHAKMMDMAFRTHNIRQVVYGLDLFAYSLHHTNQRSVTPNYLYDDSLFNDIHYWFNQNVLFAYIPQALARIGTPDEDASRDTMYAWDPPEMPSADDLRSLVDLSSPMPTQSDPTYGLNMMQDNLLHNLLPSIQAHPETTFLIFLPPYSVLHWAQEASSGKLDMDLAQRHLLAEVLLAEPNVILYDFQTRLEWITDLSLYYDLMHYISSINEAMVSDMQTQTGRITSLDQIDMHNTLLAEQVRALFPQ